jgi:hypothetical protein
VTDEDGRLAALAALLAPALASNLLVRLGTPGAREASAHAQRLVVAPRRERLQALSAALAGDARALAASSETAASLERRAVAAVVRAVGAGEVAAGAARACPILLRLCREWIGR